MSPAHTNLSLLRRLFAAYGKVRAFFQALRELFAIGDEGDCQEPEFQVLSECQRERYGAPTEKRVQVVNRLPIFN